QYRLPMASHFQLYGSRPVYPGAHRPDADRTSVDSDQWPRAQREQCRDIEHKGAISIRVPGLYEKYDRNELDDPDRTWLQFAQADHRRHLLQPGDNGLRAGTWLPRLYRC